MVWRFFNDTGKSGGTASPADNTFYVDSYKGSDLNNGSNTAPFQTIQKCLDESATGGCDIIIAGIFKEGDFLNSRNNVSLIAEGDVYVEPDLATDFTLTSYGGQYSVSFNIDTFDSNIVREYGKLHFKDFEIVRFGGYLATSPMKLIGAHNCEFKDIITFAGGLSIKLVQKCVFDNTIFQFNQFNGGGTDRYSFHQNNNFINGAEWRFSYVAGAGGRLRDNYWDATSTINQLTYGGGPAALAWRWQNNHAEGSFVGKIQFSTLDYNDLNAAQTAFSTGIFDSVPNAQSPQFSGLNSDDYSYATASPNATGGWSGGPIGAFGIGYSTNNVDSGGWSASNITITGVGANSVANITTPGTIGVIEETVGQVLNIDDDVYVGATYLPGLIQDFSAGQVADKTKSADGGSPSIPTLEISTSVTGGATYSSWIEVPIGVVPLIDLSGKGNGDDTFDPSNLDLIHKGKIPARYVKRRITLRDDETPLT